MELLAKYLIGANLGSRSSLSHGGQVYEAIWAPAAASAVGDRFMKHPDLLNLTATVDQHDLKAVRVQCLTVF
ncbi:hypothetical protein DPMN_006060 [Dreissena polymorpha]|uniref:Uncharacterized protein n=1 Tax=Dreissena polymorpha TaxID=45954 RepID=A0A9D4MUQ5_DREPO|nr:hypothetical protein DPMN_006060 [Dreissena polymorpha]